MYRIIIAGSRTFNDYELLEESLNEYIADAFQKKVDSIEIISGTAKGADSLGEKYAIEHNYLIKRFSADWDKYGKSAGYIRNEKMADYASKEKGVLFAFWDAKSKGTKNMINIAKKYKLDVNIVVFK